MKRLLLAMLALPCVARAQTTPANFVSGMRLTAPQVGAALGLKADASHGTLTSPTIMGPMTAGAGAAIPGFDVTGAMVTLPGVSPQTLQTTLTSIAATVGSGSVTSPAIQTVLSATPIDVSAQSVKALSAAGVAVTRALNARFADMINAADYGVVCDNTTLNDTAFAKVYQEYQAQAALGRSVAIRLPMGGNCKISQTLAWSVTTDLRIFGFSAATSFMMTAAATDTMDLKVSNNANVTVDHMRFRKVTSGTTIAGRGLVIEGYGPDPFSSTGPVGNHNNLAGRVVINAVDVEGSNDNDSSTVGDAYSSAIELIDLPRPVLDDINIENYTIYGRQDAGLPAPIGGGTTPASLAAGVNSDIYIHGGTEATDPGFAIDTAMIDVQTNGGIAGVDIDVFQGYYETNGDHVYSMYGVRSDQGTSVGELIAINDSQFNNTIAGIYFNNLSWVQISDNLFIHAFPTSIWAGIWMRNIGEFTINGNNISGAGSGNYVTATASAATATSSPTLTFASASVPPFTIVYDVTSAHIIGVLNGSLAYPATAGTTATMVANAAYPVAANDVLHFYNQMDAIMATGDNGNAYTGFPSSISGNTMYSDSGFCNYIGTPYAAIADGTNSEVGCGPSEIARSNTDSGQFYVADLNGSNDVNGNHFQFQTTTEDGNFNYTIARNLFVGKYANIGKITVQNYPASGQITNIMTSDASTGLQCSQEGQGHTICMGTFGAYGGGTLTLQTTGNTAAGFSAITSGSALLTGSLFCQDTGTEESWKFMAHYTTSGLSGFVVTPDADTDTTYAIGTTSPGTNPAREVLTPTFLTGTTPGLTLVPGSSTTNAHDCTADEKLVIAN